MARELLLQRKYRIFPLGKLKDESSDYFDNEGEAINAYEAMIKNPQTLAARLIDIDSGRFIRRFVR